MYYCDFEFSDGSSLSGRSRAYAKQYAKDKDLKIIKITPVFGAPSVSVSSKKARVKDGFEPGWNPALGQYVSSKSEHKRLLKQKGLVEVGTEKLKEQRYTKERSAFTDENIKKMVDMGAALSGQEAKALKGEK